LSRAAGLAIAVGKPLPSASRCRPNAVAIRVYNRPMAPITPAEAREYQDRWKLIDALRLEELQRTSMDTKLRQLASLMASRGIFQEDPRREDEVREVRRRWSELRRVLGA